MFAPAEEIPVGEAPEGALLVAEPVEQLPQYLVALPPAKSSRQSSASISTSYRLAAR